MTKEEATKVLAEKLDQVKSILDECRKIAKDNKVKLVNPDGYYDSFDEAPEDEKDQVKANLLSKILTKKEWTDIGMETYWMPSSAMC